MFVVMTVGASEAEVLGVKSQILAEGLTPFDHVGAERVVIAVVGEIGARKPVLVDRLAALAGVETVTPISRPFKLTSREFHPEDTVIRVLDAVIGDGSLTMMAGPCSVESRDQLFETADCGQGGRRDRAARRRVQAADESVRVPGPRGRGAALSRRGARADRAAGDHRGDGAVAGRHRRGVRRHPPDRHPQHAELLAAARRRTGGPAGDAQARLRGDDRGMAHGGRVHRRSGNPNVILCERGIRTFETYTRNTLDLAAVPLLHHLTHLPVIVDPSHATGKRWLVRPLAIGGVAVGADGVMVEVHPTPDQALSDAEQQLDLDGFRDLMAAIVPVHEHVRGLHGAPVQQGAAAALGLGGGGALGKH